VDLPDVRAGGAVSDGLMVMMHTTLQN